MKHSPKVFPLRACARLLLAASALSTALPVQAEDEKLEMLTVTANRMPSADVLVPTTVITREDIERLQIRDLGTLLSRFPAIDFTQNGGLGKSSGVFIRGTNSDHVLFLVDGTKWFSATAGTTAIQDFPVSQIERIEIVRGPRSGLYGSEAIGGVVQIFTRKGKQGMSPYAELSVGSHNTQQITAGVNGGDQQTQYNLSVNHLSSNGINAREQQNPDHDGYRNKNVSAKLNHRMTDNWRIGANFLRAEADNEYDGFVASSDYTSDSVQQVLGLHNDYQLNDKWMLQLNLSESRDQSAFFDDNAADGVFNTRHRAVNFNNLVDIANGHRLNIGFDYENDKVDSSNDYDESSRDNKAVFVSWQADIARHAWLLSMRHDDNEAFGSKNTGNAEYGYWLQDDLRVSLNAGTGFKAPTFNDLYWPVTAYSAGNPNLSPEESKSIAAGLTGTPEWGHWAVNIYQNKIEDLIDWQEVSPWFWTPTNISDAKIKGIELELNTVLWGWDMAVDATMLQPENDETGKLLPQRAKRLANIHLDRTFGDWSAGASWKLTGHRFKDEDNTVRLGGYGLLDLRVAYQLDQDWTVRISASNVFDKNYQTVDSYRSLDRTFMLTLSYQP